jgi:tRNA G18 (ribose-2'-O)-methylase SpoU
MVARPEWIKNYSNSELKQILHPKRIPLEIAVYGSQNYFNFGSIVRVSHNFLCEKIYSIDMDGGKYYKKATMGAKKYETIVPVTMQEFLEKTKNKNLVSFERRPGLQAKCIHDYVWPENPVVVFGGEKFGIPEEILNTSKDVVEIPVDGLLNDFNIAIACGIAVYDWKHKNDSNQSISKQLPLF